MKRIILIPYFGDHWPVWFPLYINSVRYNIGVLDVLLITNIKVDNINAYPSNIKIVYASFEEYCDLVSKKLNINFKPTSPYKLCDLKPFLPIIHSDLLSSYDYVGFGDIDLIYGDLQEFFNSVSRKYNIISTHNDRISGHFALMKNRPSILRKAFKIPKWKEVLEDNKHHGIDEGSFSYAHFPLFFGCNYILRYKLKLHKLSQVLCKSIPSFFRKAYLKEHFTTPVPLKGQKWKFKNGKILDPADKEIPYLHFLFFKKTEYNPNNTNYWQPDFYNLTDPVEEKEIEIDIKGIRYI